MMKMTTEDKKIARAIILAQVASDGGKGIPDLKRVFKEAYPVWKAGYAAKDGYIHEAILRINKSKSSRFRYYVDFGDLEDSILVYFEYTFTDQDRIQVSFHSFDETLIRWMQKNKTHVVMTWDEGGELGDSRASCIVLRWLMTGSGKL